MITPGLLLEPSLVLDLTLYAMVKVIKSQSWEVCLSMLINFIIEDLESDWLAQVMYIISLIQTGSMLVLGYFTEQP